VDPHHLDADPDAHPDSSHHSDADLDPTFHPDADPDPSFQIKIQTLKKCSNRLIFHTFWLVICKLMRIRFRIQLITLMRIWIRMRIHADPCGSGSGSTRLQVACYDQSLWVLERPYAGEGGGVDDESAPPTLLQAHVLQGHLSALHHRHLQEKTVL
jgi:hypothetical protein